MSVRFILRAANAQVRLCLPSRHTTLKQRRINVDATSYRRWYGVVLTSCVCWVCSLMWCEPKAHEQAEIFIFRRVLMEEKMSKRRSTKLSQCHFYAEWGVLSATSPDIRYAEPFDKTNKIRMRRAKTQTSQGIRPVCLETSLCGQWVTMDPKSKWVWSGNTTITNCRPNHGTVRKSYWTSTVTRHPKRHQALSSSSRWLQN